MIWLTERLDFDELRESFSKWMCRALCPLLFFFLWPIEEHINGVESAGRGWKQKLWDICLRPVATQSILSLWHFLRSFKNIRHLFSLKSEVCLVGALNRKTPKSPFEWKKRNISQSERGGSFFSVSQKCSRWHIKNKRRGVVVINQLFN